jgi:hypothetical protein
MNSKSIQLKSNATKYIELEQFNTDNSFGIKAKLKLLTSFKSLGIYCVPEIIGNNIQDYNYEIGAFISQGVVKLSTNKNLTERDLELGGPGWNAPSDWLNENLHPNEYLEVLYSPEKPLDLSRTFMHSFKRGENDQKSEGEETLFLEILHPSTRIKYMNLNLNGTKPLMYSFERKAMDTQYMISFFIAFAKKRPEKKNSIGNLIKIIFSKEQEVFEKQYFTVKEVVFKVKGSF